MKAFVDIAGASGASYRFHRLDQLARLPATAGNFIFTRARLGGVEVVCCGAVSSLIHAVEVWRTAATEHQADAIYVRLNVSRVIRSAEHHDIAAKQAPMVTITEPG